MLTPAQYRTLLAVRQLYRRYRRPLSTDEVAAALGIGYDGARLHLQSLVRADYARAIRAGRIRYLPATRRRAEVARPRFKRPRGCTAEIVVSVSYHMCAALRVRWGGGGQARRYIQTLLEGDTPHPPALFTRAWGRDRRVRRPSNLRVYLTPVELEQFHTIAQAMGTTCPALIRGWLESIVEA